MVSPGVIARPRSTGECQRLVACFVGAALGLLAMLALLAPGVLARQVRIDPGFGSNGTATPSVGPSFGLGWFTIAPRQAEGALLATYLPGVNEGPGTFYRYLDNGQIDPSFPPQSPPPASASPSGPVATLPDGSSLTSAGGGYLERYGPNGALDTSYGSGGHSATVPFSISRILPLPSGQVLVAGTLAYQSFSRNSISRSETDVARLNADGSLDGSFGGGNGVVGSHANFGLEGDRLAGIVELVGGGFAVVVNLEGEARALVVGLTAAGALDPSFGSSGKVQLALIAVSAHPTAAGGVEIAGNVRGGRRSCCADFALVRLGASGAPDPGFGQRRGWAKANFGADDRLVSVLWEGDGSVLLAGSTTEMTANCAFFLACWETPALAHFGAQGNLDRSFGRAGLLELSSLRSAMAHSQEEGVRELVSGPGGDTFAAGRSGPTAFLALIGPDGGLSSGFGAGGIVTRQVPQIPQASMEDAVVDRRGRILLVGSTDAGLVNGPSTGAVFRYTPSGRLDPSYGAGGHAFAGIVFGGSSSIAVDRAGGAVVAAGSTVMRLTPSGHPDLKFGKRGVVHLPTGMRLSGVRVLPNGKVLLTRAAVRIGKSTMTLRLLRNGRVDPSYRDGLIGCAPERRCAELRTTVDGGGRLLFAGFAVKGGGGPALVVGRLRDDGRLDPAFGQRGRAVIKLHRRSAIAGVAVGGRRIFVAAWSSSGGGPRVSLFALNANGRLDRSFGRGGIASVSVPRFGSNAILRERISLLPTGGRIVLVRSGAGPPVLAFDRDGRPVALANDQSSLVPVRSGDAAPPSPIGVVDQGRVVLAWNQETPSGHGGVTTRIALQRLLVR